MRHLSNDERLAVAEGQPDAGGHLEACPECRAAVDTLRETLALVREDAVPEPSPLFWEHLSRRVREAVAAEPASAPGWLGRVGRWRPLAAAGALGVVAVAAWLMWAPAPTQPQPEAGPPMPAAAGSAGGVQVVAGAVSVEDVVAEDDSPWQLVVDLASDLDLETAPDAGLFILPGSTERAVGQLSEEERQAFAELLRQEIARPVL